MSNTPKLTDEQREKYISHVRRYLQGAEYAEQYFDAIVSSEQEWKEEAEKWRAYSWTADEKLRYQLNQAIEVLNHLLQNNAFSTGEDAREARVDIEFILSSLQEDKP